MSTTPTATADSLAALVVIARAAHLDGERALATAARRRLAEEYGVRIVFHRAPPQPTEPRR
ncbi:MAG: hypothetical protein ACOC46_00565 [Pirellulales bacterium]